MELQLLAGFEAGGEVATRTARIVAEVWAAGGLAALPTETVYGLAADAQNAVAVARIYQVKGRPANHPLIVHVADRSVLAAWSHGPNPVADALTEAFWPGPLTLVVRRSGRAVDHITGGQDSVALRCPGHPVALACLRALCELTGDPARGVAAPSANRFGRVSPTSASDVLAELADRLDPLNDLVVDGGTCAVGLESTIVDCRGGLAGQPRPRVLRPGAISQEQIDDVFGRGAAVSTALGESVGVGTLDFRPAREAPEPESAPGSRPRADDPGIAPGSAVPAAGRTASERLELRVAGMLASHYAPAADVIVLQASAATRLAESVRLPRATGTGLVALDAAPTPEGWVRLAAPHTVQQYAQGLYAALRRGDDLGLSCVVAVLPPPGGALAAAIGDRLARAAHGVETGPGATTEA